MWVYVSLQEFGFKEKTLLVAFWEMSLCFSKLDPHKGLKVLICSSCIVLYLLKDEDKV